MLCPGHRRAYIMRHDNRREFLRTAGAAALLGANDRINLAVVGIGGRGRDHIDGFAKQTQCRIVAVIVTTISTRSVTIPKTSPSTSDRRALNRTGATPV